MFEFESPAPTHCVLYTDGGYWPNVNIGGWGVHGYFFTAEPAKTGSGCKKALPSAQGYLNGKSGKPDILISHYVDAFETVMHGATNNVAELSAAIRALEIARDAKVTHLTLFADSKYVLQGITEWLPNWVKHDWVLGSGKPVANSELWKKLDHVYNELKQKGVTIDLRWVKGHSGDCGNDIVDKLSTLSICAGSNGRWVSECVLSPAKGYWKSEKKQSRLLNLSAWYYGVNDGAFCTSFDGRTIYYQGELRDDEEFNGKRISDACFSVVYLREPDPILETIRAESLRLAKASYYGLAVGSMREIFKPENYSLIEQYGPSFLIYDLSRNRLMNYRKETLVEERRPARRAYYAVDRLQLLERILVDYLKNDGKDAPGCFYYNDVTDLLYETVAEKKKEVTRLKPAISQSTKYIDVDVRYSASGSASVRLVLSQDLPDRNTLAALAEEIRRVTVVTWPDSESAIRFATIVETTNDVGIWSGVYSNLSLLPTTTR